MGIVDGNKISLNIGEATTNVQSLEATDDCFFSMKS
jgi:hypothetical protein